MKRLIYLLFSVMILTTAYSCGSEMSDEEKQESLKSMEEEGKKMEELLPAKLD